MKNKHPALTPELYCYDFSKSRAFYTDVLGFRVDYERPEEGFAMLEREGAFLMIDQIGVDRTWATGEFDYPLGRGINLQIEVSDVDSLYETVKTAGHPIFLEMEEAWYRADNVYLGNRQFLIQDLDGYLLRFFQDIGEQDHP
jgi:catechol 2,3-dioxygenase-like lactoylglutathione lyase family enzyme